MSDFQSFRSHFPQFTEKELKEAIEISKGSVNWIEYNKWVEEGRPYEEHDEVLMNLKLEYESQTRSVETRQYADGKRECRNGVSTHRNSRNAVQNIRKTSNETPSAIGTKTTAHEEASVVPRLERMMSSNRLPTYSQILIYQTRDSRAVYSCEKKEIIDRENLLHQQEEYANKLEQMKLEIRKTSIKHIKMENKVYLSAESQCLQDEHDKFVHTIF
ncbi:hypothetical protein RhiirA4_422977 [Rhizophagus irregularis]|uniref:Uncharacterized protein n=1 Tax=Rhizophagus irregularis TaxID=588596 RepID=A0A2I1GS35_9GLOM|nr:hypothetical protein RhiirA4_422977 [Rhizophagus irregularis]